MKKRADFHVLRLLLCVFSTDILEILVNATNANSDPLVDFVFQAAVPKVSLIPFPVSAPLPLNFR